MADLTFQKPEVDDIDGIILNSTTKALRILIEGSSHWIPKSKIHNYYQEFNHNDSQTFVVDLWILKEKGLIGQIFQCESGSAKLLERKML